MPSTAPLNIAATNKGQEKQKHAIAALERAFRELCDAQDEISFVEGEGSSELYEEIAIAYQTVESLRKRLKKMTVTGYFE